MAGLCEGSNGGKTDDGVVVTPAIKVNQACQLFGVKGDEILAHSLQDKEFEAKYSWNREMRRTARTDVPLAKATHDEEEEKLQRERLHFLQHQTKLAEEDAELARQYDREEQLAKQQDRLRQEVRDQELAKRIQVLEIQEQGRPKVRRSRDDDSSEHGQVMLGGSVIRMSSFAGFHLDPTTGAGGDDGLKEEERKQLMMMQDEELALALQEHEEMRAHRLGRSQARIANRSTSEEHVTQQSIVIPAQPERFQSTAAPRRPSDVQPVLTSRGCDQTDGFSQPPPPRPPPLSGQHPSRSHGPPARQAPRAPVQHVRTDDAYLNPLRTTSNSNDVSGKTVTLVTSVGKSEFFRTIPATEARSLESKSQQQTTNHHSSSSAANNRTNNSAQTNRKDSARKDSKRK